MGAPYSFGCTDPIIGLLVHFYCQGLSSCANVVSIIIHRLSDLATRADKETAQERQGLRTCHCANSRNTNCSTNIAAEVIRCYICDRIIAWRKTDASADFVDAVHPKVLERSVGKDDRG